jgi:deleted-in-malignant-brain-tumors protein 1
VCDDDWDTGDAEVVCKQLGFDPMGSLALPNAFFGQGTGAIFLDDANCSPQNHSTLIECFASIDASVGDHDCQHREDASVVCSSDCEDCNCTNGALRLRGGATDLEGRVEVCINGVWGTICRNFWDGPDAAVVCKQLGLAQTDAAAVTDGRFGAGTGVILWDNFLCRGTEEALLECYHERPQNGTCSHLQDVGVRCSRFVCNNGDIRLADGPYDSDGRLEICFDQRYGAICDNGFGSTEAAIACRQLGYNDGQGAIALPNGFFGFGPPITTSRVSCTGTESTLTECIYNANRFCFPTRVVSVLCQSSNASCTNGDIRLAGSTDPHAGRVEVCFNSHWGSVCQIGWTNIDALTVCSIVGYNETKYAISTAGSYFGSVDGPIFLQSVNCSGREDNLLQCLVQSPGDTSCRHSQDVGVVCPGINTFDPQVKYYERACIHSAFYHLTNQLSNPCS